MWLGSEAEVQAATKSVKSSFPKKFVADFSVPNQHFSLLNFGGKGGVTPICRFSYLTKKCNIVFRNEGRGGGGRFIQIQGSDRPSAPSIYGQCFITADSRCYQTNSVAFFTGSICFIFITRSLGDLPGPDFQVTTLRACLTTSFTPLGRSGRVTHATVE